MSHLDQLTFFDHRYVEDSEREDAVEQNRFAASFMMLCLDAALVISNAWAMFQWRVPYKHDDDHYFDCLSTIAKFQPQACLLLKTYK
jgi:hypothetical protein